MSKIKSPENRLDKIKRQLKHILNDGGYYMNEGYREFVTSMHNSIGSRKVTKRMEMSMDKVIVGYKKYLKSGNKDYVGRTAKLSIKQKKALNQMYKRFKKKCEDKGIHDVQIEMR